MQNNLSKNRFAMFRRFKAGLKAYQPGPTGAPGPAGQSAEVVQSVTPADGYQVGNMYVDLSGPTPLLAFEYDDAMMGVNTNPGLIASNPPPGLYAQVINFYVDQATGRLAFTYDDGL